MVEDNIKKARTIVSSLRKLLLNYELEETFCKSQIELCEIKQNKYRNGRSKWEKKQFILVSADLEKNNIMLKQIEKAKNDLSKNCDLILSNYNEDYRNIFSLFYIKEKTVEEISNKLKLPLNDIISIINRMNDDFIDLYEE